MADVLLIYPSHRRVLAGRTYSPLGLVYIASMLEREEFSVRILDLEVEELTPEELASVLANEAPSIIGINTLTTALPEVFRLVNFFREHSNAIIVVGGSHVTCEPSVVSDLNVEYGIRGEGEYSFLKLCKFLLRGVGSLESIEGLVANNGGVVKAENPTFVDDLNALPLPDRSLVKTRDYMFNTVLTSRGCPFNCIFCADVSTKPRSRSPESVVVELKQMARDGGLRQVEFADSVFTLDKDRVMRLCELIRGSGLKLRWSCLTRCDLVDEELLNAMKAAGCYLIFFGVESGVQEVRYRIGKNISDNMVRYAFDICHDVGIKTGVSAMFGHPNETLDDMRKTIDFACSLNATYGIFSVSELMPGTRLFEIAQEEGFANRNLWRDYMLGRVPNLYYTPKGVSFKQVMDVVVEAHRRFYCNLPYVVKRIGGVSSKIELDETIDVIKHYCIDRLSARNREA